MSRLNFPSRLFIILFGFLNPLMLLPINIRVLLGEWRPRDGCDFTLESDSGFVLSSLNGNGASARNRLWCKQSVLRFAQSSDGIFVNGKRLLVPGVRVEPVNLDKALGYNGRSYSGSMLFLADAESSKNLLVNEVELEDYVFSVLKTEGWPGWPVEVYKVFALTCRSYAMSHALNGNGRRSFYHLHPTIKHQTYSGMHKSEVIRRAVDETAGLFLAYQGSPIVAMFDSCCGGIIPANVDWMDRAKFPYLARDYPCEFCRHCKIFKWHATVGSDEFLKAMGTNDKEFGKLLSVSVKEHDGAGLVRCVIVRSKKRSKVISGRKFYGMLPSVKSLCFEIKYKNDRLDIMGTGFGHHVGLCQWGAKVMVDNGWDYKRILKYYYPETYFMRLIDSKNAVEG